MNAVIFLPNSKIPLPSEVEISESGMCNRKCSFCPRSNNEWIDKFDKKSHHHANMNFAMLIKSFPIKKISNQI